MKKTAVISGCYGQDGSYLSEKLIAMDYDVYGICRKNLSVNSSRIKNELVQNHINIKEVVINIYDYNDVSTFIERIKPEFFFHLAAIHRSSADKGNSDIRIEKELFDNNVLATSNILCACAEHSKNTRIVCAGSCLMFDASDTVIQDEKTAFLSHSMYGLAKITENELVRMYRRKGVFACTAILYNHESHRRDDCFITKKIVKSIREIVEGKIDRFTIGNIETQKDWGHAKDYVKGMILMAQADDPKDYILATGELHSIEEYLSECSKIMGLDDWRKYVNIDKSIIRRDVRGQLRGDSSLIEDELKWKREYDFYDMIREVIYGQ